MHQSMRLPGAAGRPWLSWPTAKLDELLDGGMNRHEFILRFTLSHPGCRARLSAPASPGTCAAMWRRRRAGCCRMTSTPKRNAGSPPRNPPLPPRGRQASAGAARSARHSGPAPAPDPCVAALAQDSPGQRRLRAPDGVRRLAHGQQRDQHDQLGRCIAPGRQSAALGK